MYSGGVNNFYELYKAGKIQYNKNQLMNSLSVEEKNYLENHIDQNGKIKIAYERDNYPICFYNNAERKFQGIAIDILDGISAVTGLEFTPVDNTNLTWKQVLQMLETGEVSMLTQLLYSKEREEKFIWADTPYVSSRYALLSKENVPYLSAFQVADMKVGTLNNTIYENNYHIWFPDNNNAMGYETRVDGLDALERGDIDLLMAIRIYFTRPNKLPRKIGL